MSSHWFHRQWTAEEHKPTDYTCLKCGETFTQLTFQGSTVPRSCPGCRYACCDVACRELVDAPFPVQDDRFGCQHAATQVGWLIDGQWHEGDLLIQRPPLSHRVLRCVHCGAFQAAE